MDEKLKVGDVVLVECSCEHCTKHGPPDPGPNNGPYIIEDAKPDGVIARIPFGNGETRFWPSHMPIKFKVVGRA